MLEDRREAKTLCFINNFRGGHEKKRGGDNSNI
jgi:hypothetical protein